MNQNDVAIVNQTAAQSVPFVVLQGSWVQLSPYGDFPHSNGLQRVDRAGAEELAQSFNSFSGKLGRRFAGVPFYVGHPDAPGFERMFPDHKAYGWVMALEAREDGLYGQVKWSAAGSDLISNAHYKFLSPYWEARAAGATPDAQQIYIPRKLISVGLTNQPNLPVLPLANHELPPRISLSKEENNETNKNNEMNNENINPNTTSTEARIASPPPIPHSLAPQRGEGQGEGFPPALVDPRLDALANDFRAAQQLAAQDRARFLELQARLDTLNQRFLNTMLDGAIATGKILPTEREHWLRQLETDFDGKSAELANAKPMLKTQFQRTFTNQSRSGAPQSAAEFKARQKQIQSMVNRKMVEEKLDYTTAWCQLRDEHADLFGVTADQERRAQNPPEFRVNPLIPLE